MGHLSLECLMDTVAHVRPWMLWLALTIPSLGNCAGWRRASMPYPASFEPRQQVQVWYNGRNVLWHGVELRGDSIRGIPYHRPLDCDSCRLALPLPVDSLRLGSLERVGWFVAASPWIVGAALLVYLRWEWGDD